MDKELAEPQSSQSTGSKQVCDVRSGRTGSVENEVVKDQNCPCCNAMKAIYPWNSASITG